MVTLAPELPGALAVIAALSERGVVVSLGHSAAQGDEVAAAVAAGATAVTHLFNGMGPISARSAGLAGTALSDPRLRLQVIADGVHVATEMLLVVVAAAPGRWSIVTDATSVAGLGDGSFMLGQVPIERSGGVARRPDGTMAGGASSLLHAVRHLCSLSVGLADVLAAASERPAQLMGRPDVGLLRPGGPADLIVLDDGLELTEVLVEGRPLDR